MHVYTPTTRNRLVAKTWLLRPLRNSRQCLSPAAAMLKAQLLNVLVVLYNAQQLSCCCSASSAIAHHAH